MSLHPYMFYAASTQSWLALLVCPRLLFEGWLAAAGLLLLRPLVLPGVPKGLCGGQGGGAGVPRGVPAAGLQGARPGGRVWAGADA